MPPTEKVKKKREEGEGGVQEKGKEEEESLWWGAFILSILLTLATRLYKVDNPNWICWDETHFGKMGSWYINRTFFFDVHPPLGKMMIAGMGYITGYNGTHPFEKPGQSYEDHSILGMRAGCTLLGCAIVPFSYLTVWDLTGSVSASVLASSFIIFDIGMATLNRYILLDPILLFFISGSVCAMMRFRSLVNQPFSNSWWFWLAATGSMLAGAISVKFVGLFVVLFVGIFTIGQLWDILGDLSKPLSYTVKHFLSRAVCLILLPALLYITFFYIHLSVLSKTGTGDGFYSSLYQTTLEGNRLQNATVPAQVAYGAQITLKNHRTGGAYLHSHFHLYPDGFGSKQQQVTTYAHKDENNVFVIKKWNEDAPNITDPQLEIEFVKNGDLVRLEHLVTRRNVHSHNQPAPVSKRHFQVTGYGENGTGDANDVWRLEIPGAEDGEIVRTVVSKIKFHHYFVKCVLTTTTKTLPKWGFEQGEIACNPTQRDPNSLWNVEDNTFPLLPNVSLADMAPGFISKFIESHRVMIQGNSGLKPKEGEWTSKPWEWPVNMKGQWFSAGEELRIYLLGNPIIWWGNLVFLAVFIAVYVFHSFKGQRGDKMATENTLDAASGASSERALVACGWLFLGWCMHYIPFYTMGRVLYYHHYFPALLFSSMLSGVIVDYIIREVCRLVPDTVRSSVLHSALGAVIAVAAYSYYIFSPLVYGMEGDGGYGRETNSSLHKLHWIDSWEF